MGRASARSRSEVPSAPVVEGPLRGTEEADHAADAVVIDLRRSDAVVVVGPSLPVDGVQPRRSSYQDLDSVAYLPHGSIGSTAAPAGAQTRSATRAAGSAYQVVKWALDTVAALVGLILLSPMFLALTLAIWLDDSGPALFRQERVGKHGRRFKIIKFRTMAADSDQTFHRDHTARLFEMQGELYIPDDPRITRVGKHLRRWSLDEVPNLINVLIGQMSLIGPRPLVPYEVEYLSPQQRRRLEVKPGISGLAQVSGRLWLRPDDRTSLDIEYVDNQSLWLDLRLLARTFSALVRTRG